MLWIQLSLLLFHEQYLQPIQPIQPIQGFTPSSCSLVLSLLSPYSYHTNSLKQLEIPNPQASNAYSWSLASSGHSGHMVHNFTHYNTCRVTSSERLWIESLGGAMQLRNGGKSSLLTTSIFHAMTIACIGISNHKPQKLWALHRNIQPKHYMKAFWRTIWEMLNWKTKFMILQLS